MKFTKGQKERKAAALVALAQEQKEEADGNCLGAEEMASLLEGNCSAGEEAACWSHLAGCSRCYEQWYFLKSEAEVSGKEGLLVHLRRRKNLAIAGSALAAAASIAVIVNIIHDPLSGDLAHKSVSSLPMKEAPDTISPRMMAEEAAGTSFSLSKPAMVEQLERGEKTAERSERRDVIMSAVSESQNKPAGARTASKTKMKAVVEKPESVEQWLEQVKDGCLKKRRDKVFWAEIIFSGESLLPRDETTAQADKELKAIALAVLQMVPQQYDSETVVKQCDLIFARLAEDGNNR